MLRRQSFPIPVTLVVGPYGVGDPGHLTAFHAEVLELPAGLKRREKITPPPGTASQHHALPIIRPKGSLIYHLRQCRIRMVHQRLEPGYAFVIKSRQHDHETASRPQFSRSQRKESLPVLGSLPMEMGALGAGAA